MTRRRILSTAASALALGTAHATDDQPKSNDKVDMKADHKFIMEAGLTAEEAECWRLAAETAGKFFELEKLHPMDTQEVASAIHVVQNKLLSRPTYRKYLAAAKKGK
jgi:hypothetical protein